MSRWHKPDAIGVRLEEVTRDELDLHPTPVVHEEHSDGAQQMFSM